MSRGDQERLLAALLLALVLHAGIFIGIWLRGWDFEPYPEVESVYVELPPLEEPEPVEGEPEPEPIAPEPEPVPIIETPVVQEPAPEPEPVAPATATPAPQPTTPSPAAGASTTPAPQEQMATYNVREAGQTGGGPISDEDTAASRERAPGNTYDPLALDDTEAPTTELPSWVTQGEFSLQPIESLDDQSRETLSEMEAVSPGFAARLDAIMNAVASPPTPGARPSTTTTTGTPQGTATSTVTALPGGGEIDWGGVSSRRPAGELAMPRLVAEDFGGLVPSRISYVVVFQVNSDGLVAPGSVILRQSSGYTSADEKMRAVVYRWRFNQSPGAAPVVGIATVHIEREDVQ